MGRDRLVEIVSHLASVHAGQLEALKSEAAGLEREDFVWHYMLQSFATWGSSRGSDGLMRDPERLARVSYDRLAGLARPERIAEAEAVFRLAKVRYPAKKAEYLADNLERIAALGGPAEVRRALLTQDAAGRKIRFLSQFKGISAKYARNIMMDVYHPDFRDHVAIDRRIQRVLEVLGLEHESYEAQERYLVEIAHEAGLDGWELDRLLYWHTGEVLSALGGAPRTPGSRLAEIRRLVAAQEAWVRARLRERLADEGVEGGSRRPGGREDGPRRGRAADLVRRPRPRRPWRREVIDPAPLQELRRRKTSGPRVDRGSVEDARTVFETLLPERAARELVFDLWADAIRRAHALAPRSWSITMFPRGVRLNIGRLLVAEVLPSTMWLTVLDDTPSVSTLDPWRASDPRFTSLERPHHFVALPALEIPRFASVLGTAMGEVAEA